MASSAGDSSPATDSVCNYARVCVSVRWRAGALNCRFYYSMVIAELIGREDLLARKAVKARLNKTKRAKRRPIKSITGHWTTPSATPPPPPTTPPNGKAPPFPPHRRRQEKNSTPRRRPEKKSSFPNCFGENKTNESVTKRKTWSCITRWTRQTNSATIPLGVQS